MRTGLSNVHSNSVPIEPGNRGSPRPDQSTVDLLQCDHQNSCMGTTNDPQKHEKMVPGTSLQSNVKTY